MSATSHEQLLKIARQCAKAKPQSYYAEPFQPHEWVMDALQIASDVAQSSKPCAHEWYQGTCAHCGATPEIATEVTTLRGVLRNRDRSFCIVNEKLLNAEQRATTISADNAALKARVERAEGDAAYYVWKLQLVIPLFEEARDALPAISLASAKLHNVRLDLGARMDKAGTAKREQFAAIAAQEQK